MATPSGSVGQDDVKIKLENGDELDGTMLTPPKDLAEKGSTAVIITHGAGGDKDEEQISLLGSEIALQGLFCLLFTHKRSRLGEFVAEYKEVVNWLKKSKDYSVKNCIIGGRSLGSQAAAELLIDKDLSGFVLGAVLLSFPLHKPGENKCCDETLLQLEKPVLFASGTKDDRCERPLLSQVLKKMKTKPEMVWIARADHSGMPPRKRKDAFEIPDYFHRVVTWMCTLAKHNYNPELATDNSPGKAHVTPRLEKRRRDLGDNPSAKRKFDSIANNMVDR